MKKGEVREKGVDEVREMYEGKKQMRQTERKMEKGRLKKISVRDQTELDRQIFVTTKSRIKT